MIDAENAIYTEIRNYLKAQFTEIDVAAEYVDTPSLFPHVSFYFSDNSTRLDCIDSSGEENAVNISIEVGVYSNKTEGRKAECKKIAEAVDTRLRQLGFNRTFMSPVTNFADSTIARWVLRFEGTIGSDHLIYRR